MLVIFYINLVKIKIMEVAFFLHGEQRFLLGLRPSTPLPPQAPQATLEPYVLLVQRLAFPILGPTVGHRRRRGPLRSRGSDWYCTQPVHSDCLL